MGAVGWLIDFMACQPLLSYSIPESVGPCIHVKEVFKIKTDLNKTWSKISQEKLNNLAMISIKK